MKLDLNRIRLDGGTQPRSELLIAVMEDYAESMRLGAEFPPVVVFFDGKDYWLADGFHRVGAWRRVHPSEPIEAEVIQGTQLEARWYSYGVNKTHGVPRSNDDKQRAVRAALLHPNGEKLSDGQIAEHVGVSDRMVAKHRKEMTPKVSESTSRTGRDGRTINTSNIGKAPRQSNGTPSNGKPRSSLKPLQPVRAPSPMEQMTSLSLPQNPVMGARALISVFDNDYLRALVAELTRHLEENVE